MDSIDQLADRYADELTAVRTLNLFVQHAGMIGRAHEVFLRGVLANSFRASCGAAAAASHRRAA